MLMRGGMIVAALLLCSHPVTAVRSAAFTGSNAFGFRDSTSESRTPYGSSPDILTACRGPRRILRGDYPALDVSPLGDNRVPNLHYQNGLAHARLALPMKRFFANPEQSG